MKQFLDVQVDHVQMSTCQCQTTGLLVKVQHFRYIFFRYSKSLRQWYKYCDILHKLLDYFQTCSTPCIDFTNKQNCRLLTLKCYNLMVSWVPQDNLRSHFLGRYSLHPSSSQTARGCTAKEDSLSNFDPLQLRHHPHSNQTLRPYKSQPVDIL